MLKLSTQARYALRAMIELSTNEGNGPLLLRDIAAAQKLPAKYLEQLIVRLRHAGLVLAERGPRGGYRISRPAHRITALDVVEAVEGPIDLLDCVRTPSVCERTQICAARGLWGRVSHAIAAVLSETTLADLRDEERVARAEGIACYQI